MLHFPLQAQSNSVIRFHSNIWKTADSGNLTLPWAQSPEEKGTPWGWGGGSGPGQSLSLHPGPFGRGAEAGAWRRDPTQEPALPTECSQVSMAPANPTRGVLETWWANPGPNPSNGLGLQLHDGRGGG